MANFNEYGSPSNFLNDRPADVAVEERPVPVQADVYDQELDEMEEDEELEETLLEEMSEVEIRLEEANCYKALLNNQLFSNRSAIAKRVENTIRDFIRQQLRILVGLESPKQQVSYKSPFTHEEEIRLKALAQKMIDRDNPNNNAPVLNKPVEVPKTQQVLPTVVKTIVTEAPKVVVQKEPKKFKKSKTKEDAPVEAKPEGEVKKFNIQLPNGQIIEKEVDVKAQALPPGYKKMSKDELYAASQQLADRQISHKLPKNGIIGTVIETVLKNS